MRRQQLRRRAPGRSSLAAAGAELAQGGWGRTKLARILVAVAGALVALAGDAPSTASGSRAPSIRPGRRCYTEEKKKEKSLGG